MKHLLKIHQHFLIHILEGRKNFEVRKNDRDYQVGDKIKFFPLDNDEGYNCFETEDGRERTIPDFEITYILSDFVGLSQGWVVLGIFPIRTREESVRELMERWEKP